MEYNRILVTGAAGFIGFYLSRILLESGVEVVGLDNMNDYYDVNLKYDRLLELGVKPHEAAKWNVTVTSATAPNFRFIRLNLEDRDALPQLFAREKFDAVVNLAAQAGVRYSLENPNSYIDSNVVGFLNVLECCRHHQIKHLLYASSSSVYGENGKIPFAESDRVDYPVSLYAATKRSNELMAHAYSHLYKIPTSGLRFFTVYGPWGRPDMAPMMFASAISEGRPIKVFNNGDMSRDFTYIDDIVQGILLTLKNPPKAHTKKAFYQLLNIGNGAPVSLLEFIETLEKHMGQLADKIMMPMQPWDLPRTWADTTELGKMGYKSNTPVSKGVEKFVSWFKEYYGKPDLV